MTEQEIFYSRANRAVETVGLVALGWFIGRCIRDLSVRGRWFLLAVVGCAVGWFLSIDSDPYSESGETTPMTYAFAAAGVFFIIALVQETRANVARLRAEQYAAQQQYAAWYAQQQQAQAQQPATQRVERSVTVVRAPQGNVRSYQPSDVQKAIAERSQPRPVRHREDHGSFTINDRRGFDPDLGQ